MSLNDYFGPELINALIKTLAETLEISEEDLIKDILAKLAD